MAAPYDLVIEDMAKKLVMYEKEATKLILDLERWQRSNNEAIQAFNDLADELNINSDMPITKEQEDKVKQRVDVRVTLTLQNPN